MVISAPLPFTAMRSPLGDIVVFYVGTEPRLTAEQALAFADQLRELAGDPMAAAMARLAPGPAPCPPG
ncbi:hypothetical protein [Nonomuraea lactucae]|uniref:hypothetical protein n=1 Tax=Nonomuraea lactucae TaxID=2249762 RepID=UPI0013B3D1CF|nr:hypothetical protein [Nonomuraea lactucae]